MTTTQRDRHDTRHEVQVSIKLPQFNPSRHSHVLDSDINLQLLSHSSLSHHYINLFHLNQIRQINHNGLSMYVSIQLPIDIIMMSYKYRESQVNHADDY